MMYPFPSLFLRFQAKYPVTRQQVQDEKYDEAYPEFEFFPGGMKPFFYAFTCCLRSWHQYVRHFLKGLAGENRLPELVHAFPAFFLEPPCLVVSLRYQFLQLLQRERFGVVLVLVFNGNHTPLHSGKIPEYPLPFHFMRPRFNIFRPRCIHYDIVFPLL